MLKELYWNTLKPCTNQEIGIKHLEAPDPPPTFWVNFILTQFLTNHGSFRSYLHKMNKTPSPTCSYPEKAVQMAHCSLFSSELSTVLQTLPPPLVLKYHINTVGVTRFLRNIFHTLQEQPKGNQTP